MEPAMRSSSFLLIDPKITQGIRTHVYDYCSTSYHLYIQNNNMLLTRNKIYTQ